MQIEAVSEVDARVYYSAGEDRFPELLFFEEEFIRNTRPEVVPSAARSFWQKLRERYDHAACEAFAGDRFIRRLKPFKKITVFLSRPIEASVVKEKLRTMLRERSYHHLRWMIIDLALLPVVLLPALLPGPNIIGYYLLFRVISHWKAYRSACDTNLEEVNVEVTNRAEEVRQFFQKFKDVRAALHELREKFGLRALQEHKFIPPTTIFRDTFHRLRQRLSHESPKES